MMLANKNKIVSKNAFSCTKCGIAKPKVEFLNSKGRICNDCFKDYEKIINLKVGDSVIYQSPISGLSEEMIITKVGELRGHHWYVDVKPLSKANEDVEGASVFVTNVKFFPQGDKNQLVECHTCKKETPLYELEDNAKVGSYGFKMICNTCSDEIDRQMDAQQQDKA